MRENLERYKNEQPVIDSERQLSGKVVDEDVLTALERTDYMTPEHLLLIDTILTLPAKTIEAEYQRRILAIHAVSNYCGVEEGAPYQPCPYQSPSAADGPEAVPSMVELDENDKLQKAIASVCVDSPEKRPTICFLCVGDRRLPIKERTRVYKDAGSLSRHFRRKHVNPPWPEGKTVQCHICQEQLPNKIRLLIHGEHKHGTVSRVPV